MKSLLSLTHCRIRKHGTTGLFLTLAATSFQDLERANADAAVQTSANSQLDQKKQFSGSFVRQLGFVNGDIAVFEDVQGILANTGQVVLWNVRKHKFQKALRFSKWIDNYSLVLSPDGTWLAANNSRTSPEFPHVKAYRLTAVRSSNFSTVKTSIYGEREDSSGLLFLSNDRQHIWVYGNSI